MPYSTCRPHIPENIQNTIHMKYLQFTELYHTIQAFSYTCKQHLHFTAAVNTVSCVLYLTGTHSYYPRITQTTIYKHADKQILHPIDVTEDIFNIYPSLMSVQNVS